MTATPPPAALGAPPATTPAAILVVEDERIIAKGIEKRLRGLGYAVAGSAGTGEDAVRLAAELRPDLVLMDINLGRGIDGVEAAGRVRAAVDVPVVFLTAHSDRATLDRAKLTGPHGYVLKPFEDGDLQTAIEIGLYRHRMDRRLRENEAWLAATLGSIGDGVIATDADGQVRFMNAVAEALTGWRSAEAAGRCVREVFNVVEEASARPVPDPATEALRHGRVVTLARDFALVDRAGHRRPIDDSAAPIKGVDGRVSGAVLVFRDISERRRLEEHLRQAQKMEAIGRLAGGIAHDFNNIMTVITGFSELLLANAEPPEPWREYVRSIADAGQRAAGLTRQIMAYSRRQMLVPTVLNLNTVVRDMGGMVRRLIGADIEFVTDPAPDLGNVKADPTQIGQVILNLAANARDAMPRGGRLVFATANTALGEETTRDHPDLTPGRYAVLSVADTGCGMAEDVRARIFEPFYTTKPVGQGTGLGLATVYGIVKQSGGHVEADSRVGRGSTFRVYLPLVEGAQAQPGSGVVRPPTRGGDETILLVEDEEAVRRMAGLILRRAGYTVLEAGDGAVGAAVGAGHDGPIHLLMTDLVMPRLSGREMADGLLAARPGLKILFTSGYTEDVVVKQGAETATVDFLPKPFSLEALTLKVREVLDRS